MNNSSLLDTLFHPGGKFPRDMKVQQEQPDTGGGWKVSKLFQKLANERWSNKIKHLGGGCVSAAGNEITLHLFFYPTFNTDKSNKSVRRSASNFISFTQSWHSLPAWKAVIAARQVKQIWFHSYLVTVRFSFSCAGCNRICLVPLGLGRNLLPSSAGDGQRQRWLTVAGGGSVGSGFISALFRSQKGKAR